jgi:hypothetical protein
MFWQSVIDGILAFFSWRIILGTLVVALISLVPMFLGSFIFASEGSGVKKGMGFFLAAIGAPIVQAIAISFFVLFCLPSIIGDGGFTPASVVWDLRWPIIKAGIIAMVIVLFISLIPILGRFISDTPGTTIFLQGIFVMKPFIKSIFSEYGYQLPDEFFPGILACIGYVVIGVIVCFAMACVISMVDMRLQKGREPEPLFSEFLAVAIGPIAAILPLLMYGRYFSNNFVE